MKCLKCVKIMELIERSYLNNPTVARTVPKRKFAEKEVGFFGSRVLTFLVVQEIKFVPYFKDNFAKQQGIR